MTDTHDDRLALQDRAHLALVQQQLKKVTDNAQLLKLVETPLAACFLLGVVRGQLNCMADLDLISGQQANELAEEIKVLYDQRFPGLAEHLQGPKH